MNDQKRQKPYDPEALLTVISIPDKLPIVLLGVVRVTMEDPFGNKATFVIDAQTEVGTSTAQDIVSTYVDAIQNIDKYAPPGATAAEVKMKTAGIADEMWEEILNTFAAIGMEPPERPRT